ncbi:MAG: class I SAM-dependent methyltransferase [Bacteroidota bacterium]
MLSLIRAAEPHVVPPLLALAVRASRRLAPKRKTRLREALRRALTAREEVVQAPIGRLRTVLAADTTPVAMQDFGAGTRTRVLGTEAKPTARSIAEIYRAAAASPVWGDVLFRLVRALRPLRVLELGTNLGVSAGHLQAALSLNQLEDAADSQPGLLVSIEGDPTLADAARAHLHDLRAAFGEGASTTTTVVTGRFDDALPDVLDAHGPFDLVFLDGHHDEAATRRYFARIAPHLAPGACVVFDDIEPGHAVRRAWSAICAEYPYADRLDLGKLGLLFVDSA